MNYFKKLLLDMRDGKFPEPEKPEKEYRIIEETFYRVEKNYKYLGWTSHSLFFDSAEEARAYIEAEKSAAPAVEPKVVEEL